MLVRSGIPVLVMRGGTAQAAYLLAEDLPGDPAERERLLGTGDREVVVVGRSADPGADVDCLFTRETNAWPGLLAAVGPFAVERNLVEAADRNLVEAADRNLVEAADRNLVEAADRNLVEAAEEGDPAQKKDVVPVRVRMVATGVIATVHVRTRGGRPEYTGDTAISGVPGTAALLLIEFAHTETLLPTGHAIEDLCGIPATLIGSGSPVLLVPAAALGVTGYETPARLEYDERLRARLEMLATRAAVPEICLVAPPSAGGGLCVRMFVSPRMTPSIGVGSAMSVAAAAAVPGSVAARLRRPAASGVPGDVLRLETSDGYLDVQAEVSVRAGAIRMGRSAVVSTARLLLDGQFYAPPA